MKTRFTEWQPRGANRKLLQDALDIIEEYQGQGYNMTVRQVYYQMVSRSLIPNHVKQYNRLVELLKDGRLGGFIDWGQSLTTAVIQSCLHSGAAPPLSWR